jgi:transketolase
MTEAAVADRTSLHNLCVNTLRTLAMDAVERAQSGHPGTPMALAPLCYVLWTKHLRHNPANPDWPDRDRFVLSCGHASMLLYGLLHLSGYDLSLDDVRDFRQWGSRTPGHPERGVPPGAETTTGPLGQGVGNAVGMALAAAHLGAHFNRPEHRIVGHRVYFVASDGDLMEGISHEACSLAGHLRLGNLIGFFDDNRITIDGATDLTCCDNVPSRFEAYGWRVLHVNDGNDLAALDEAIGSAKAQSERPTLVIVRTHIAFGSPNKQDTPDAHGAPLGEEEVRLTKQALGWPHTEPFTIPEAALEEWRASVPRGMALEAAWREDVERYRTAHSALAAEFERRLSGRLREAWDEPLNALAKENPATATRAASGRALNAIASSVPELVGGSADLSGSNNTLVKGASTLGPDEPGGRNIHFGIREHGMAAVMNGLALHGGVIPYGGTFLVFSDYMRPSIRLAAMMGLKVVYVFTHDSIGLGEDGPTHQPVEMLATLRAIPGLVVVRPADAAETFEAWRAALRHPGPIALVLTRQKVPSLDRTALAPAAGLHRGAYVLADAEHAEPQVVLLASGSEVSVALDARRLLQHDGIGARVVSVASMELFEQQPTAYRAHVLPPDLTARVAIEAAHPMPWYRWVGGLGTIIGLDRFGASAPADRLFHEFGVTPEVVAERARQLVKP